MNKFANCFSKCKAINEKYGYLFREKWFCGSEFGNGWADIVEKCLQAVAKDRENGLDVSVAQIKEKFGTLRFYYDGMPSEETRAIIRKAENDSAVTCECTGKEGVIHYGRGWLRTLNKEYAKEIGYSEKYENER